MHVPTYVFPSAIAVWGVLRMLPWLKARAMRGRHVAGLSQRIDERQRRHRRLLVYFWSPTCVMCHGVSRVIDELARERDDVIKINAAESTDLARRFRVMGTPTLVVVQDGKVERMLVGAKSESQIRALLD